MTMLLNLAATFILTGPVVLLLLLAFVHIFDRWDNR